jgi:DNA polymerase IIIc chi subunit
MLQPKSNQPILVTQSESLTPKPSVPLLINEHDLQKQLKSIIRIFEGANIEKKEDNDSDDSDDIESSPPH